MKILNPSSSADQEPASKRQRSDAASSSGDSSSPPAFPSQEKAIEHLVKAVVGLEDSFAIGDQVDVSGLSLTFAGADGSPQRLAFPLTPYVKTADSKAVVSAEMATLIRASTPSPFGEGNQTRTDPKVRRACHVPADRILSIDGLPLERILAEVREQLFPWEESPIEASLLKLNIYQEGDFFVEHRDTPLSDRSLGSLVITLPCTHFGGDLIVRHRDDQRVFDFAKDLGIERRRYWSYGQTNTEAAWNMENVYFRTVPSLVSYAAFYGDALHEVKPVSGGIRLTLSYQLLRPVGALRTEGLEDITEAAGAPAAKKTAPAVDYARMNVEQLKTCCRDAGLKVGGNKGELVSRLMLNPTQASARADAPKVFMAPRMAEIKTARLIAAFRALLSSNALPGIKLGFPCFHLYETEAELPKDGDLNEKVRTNTIGLRGADALLAVTAARLGFHVRILRLVLCDDCADGVVITVPRLITYGSVLSLGKKVRIENCFTAFGISTEDLEEKSGAGLRVREVTWAVGIPQFLKGVVNSVGIPKAKIIDAFVSGKRHP